MAKNRTREYAEAPLKSCSRACLLLRRTPTTTSCWQWALASRFLGGASATERELIAVGDDIRLYCNPGVAEPDWVIVFVFPLLSYLEDQ